MHKLLGVPLQAEIIMKKKKSIKRELLHDDKWNELKIAILGGSTTAEVKDILELFLLNNNIKPIFYESEYDKWYEDGAFENVRLEEFKPQIIYIHTSFVNLNEFPQANDDDKIVDCLVDKTISRWKSVWNNIKETYKCVIIQNNFEAPFYRINGNLDSSCHAGVSSFVNKLNLCFSQQAAHDDRFYINDIHYLSAQIGLNNWYDRNFYHAYKFAMSYDVVPFLAYNLAAIMGACVGKSKKCLVLDLDNTLWGGIIGDDGVSGIRIGHETAEGEAYLEFQKYVLQLKQRGIILAVCSKNDYEIAKTGFDHPDSILKVDDFISFIANWEPKCTNIEKIAKEINIGLDSLVFIDDNPVERDIVRQQLPDVVVLEVEGENPASYLRAIDDSKLFEPIVISEEDLKRNQTYIENKQRATQAEQFSSYDDFLKSLEMVADIEPFKEVYLDRITQLTNKTNQFNLTTKRYTRNEIDAVAQDENYITLYARLKDKFGDNGLVGIVIGKIKNEELDINLWLMSCRVLKRGLEFAMLEELILKAKEKNVTTIKGYYYKTPKNAMVKLLFKEFGFEEIKDDGNGNTVWLLKLEDSRATNKYYIKVERG